ncbi:alpha-tocopherol transfer protein-like isoform X1 [Planococcus citri]|uniref:alpha-tocopherol transfer protein-like isoform X1 n=1 Tax=Planococcus citri TaxID=170843 RepID=UPI0031FA3BA0
MSSKYLELCTKSQLDDYFAEFGGTEESVQNDVKYLKEWMRQQPHLPNIEDEEWLTNFLLRCKNSLERTKKALERYYTTRVTMPEVFQDRDPCTKEIKELSKRCCLIPIPKLTPEGHRIVIFKIFEKGNSAPNGDLIIKATQIVSDYLMKVDKNRGLIVIMDYENINMNYITMMFSMIKQYITLVTKATPYRYHKIYFVNIIPALEPLFTIVMRLLKSKLVERITMWKEKSTKLYTVLPKELLPEKYGGTYEKTFEELRDLFFEDIASKQDWFISDEKNKADISKRPADHPFVDDDSSNYGVEGSFRKICLD